MRGGANLAHVGQYNENAVFHALRRLGPSSQTEIAEHTGLSLQTVSVIVKNLASRGYLSELRTESVGRGRPRVIMDIVGSARFAVGIHVDPAVMTTVALDLRGSVVASASSDDVDPDDPAAAMGVATDLVRGLYSSPDVSAERVIGACLAVPGPIDATSESIVETVWLPGWTGYPLGHALERGLGMRVPLVKDTFAAVIGENWVRARSSLDSTMVFVYLGMGTGVGLSLNGEPVTGYSGNAGEVGRMLLALGSRRRGAIDGLDNDPAVLVESAHERRVLPGPAPARIDFPAIDRNFRELCAMAADGHSEARAIMDEAAGRIAEMAVMTTELFDADTLVFGGPYWDSVQPWYEPVALAALAQPSARGPHPVTLVSTVMGRDVGAIGAASVVLDSRYVPRAPGSRRK